MGKLKALFNLKKYAFDSGDEITTFFIKQFGVPLVICDEALRFT